MMCHLFLSGLFFMVQPMIAACMGDNLLYVAMSAAHKNHVVHMNILDRALIGYMKYLCDVHSSVEFETEEHKNFYDLVREQSDLHRDFMQKQNSCGNTHLHSLILLSPHVASCHRQAYLDLFCFMVCERFRVDTLSEYIESPLAKYIEINQQNNNGDTPLHIAYQVGDAEIIRLAKRLVGLDSTIKNKKGYRADQQWCLHGLKESLGAVWTTIDDSLFFLDMLWTCWYE